jgi:hypothetical protein
MDLPEGQLGAEGRASGRGSRWISSLKSPSFMGSRDPEVLEEVRSVLCEARGCN